MAQAEPQPGKGMSDYAKCPRCFTILAAAELEAGCCPTCRSKKSLEEMKAESARHLQTPAKDTRTMLLVAGAATALVIVAAIGALLLAIL